MSESSSSDSEENDNMENLKEAVDCGFMNDQMFKDVGQGKTDIEKDKPKLKSERYVIDENSSNLSNTLNVSESMQDFFYKKLTKLITKNVEYVDVPKQKIKENKPMNSIKLLRGFDEMVKNTEEEIPSYDMPVRVKRQKRRLIEDLDSQKTEQEKLNEAALSPDDIQHGIEHWKSRRNRGVDYEYKEKKSVLYLQEPITEFTNLRKKNNWSESKISNKIK